MAIVLAQQTFGVAQAPKTLNFYNIDNTTGLPHNYINEIVVDSLGFVWIATNNGLCRYDSPENIKIFKKGDLGLASSNIRSLHADKDSTLWVGTSFGGITRMDPGNKEQKTYLANGENGKTLSNDEVLAIQCIEDDEVWIGTEYGLNVLNKVTDSIHQFKVDFNDEFAINASAILDIFVDNQSRIWIGTWDGGLYLYLPSKSGSISEGKFRRFEVSTHEGSRHVWKIYQDSEGRYWIATHSGGLYLMQLPSDASQDIDQQKWEPIFHQFLNKPPETHSISSDYIQDIKEDASGNIWIATVHGLNIIDKSNLDHISGEDYNEAPVNIHFQRHYYDPSLKGSLNNNNLTSILRDKQGIMWIGTISGLNQYNWYTNQFEIFNVTNSINGNENPIELINNIYLKNDDIAILASDLNGIIEYDLKNHTVIQNSKYKNDLLTNNVTYIHPDTKDLFYIGTTEGVAKVNIKTGGSTLYNLPSVANSKGKNTHISCIFKDSKGRLWVGTEDGLLTLNEQTKQYTFYYQKHDDDSSISDNSITQIFEDSHHNIWITTFDGLNLLTEKNGFAFKRFRKDNTKYTETIPSNQITAVDEYNQSVYFGTHNGLFRYKLDTKTFELIKTSDKILSFLSFEITKNGELWGATSDGVLRLNLENQDIKLFSKNDGIGDLSFSINTSFKDKNEDIYFGGIRGFVKIQASNIKKNTKPPNIYITEIETINSTTTNNYTAIHLQEIELEPDNFYLSINYAAPNNNQGNFNQYAYKLEGFGDEDWKYVGNKQQAIYTNLEPGEYTFKVKGSNNEGIWSTENATLKIKVKPTLLETTWIQLLAAIFSFGLLQFSILWYTRNIKKRNQFLSDYNQKLNAQIDINELAQKALEKRETYMKRLLSKLDVSNKELVRSNKDLEQFAYVASHDMKEPLRTVGTFTDLLHRKYYTSFDPAAQSYLNFISEGVDRMSALINSLLTYSQVGKQDVEFKLIDINNLVKSKIKDLSHLIEESNATINIHQLPKVHCVGNQIGMVFYNLILNALKFNKSEQPKITISCEEDKEFWTFAVSDNGIGIAKEYQNQIFEIFKRLHRREEYEGTGIGLALCSKIVHRHDGKIWLNSEAGLGSIFYFTISKHIRTKEDKDNDNSSKYLEKEVEKILRA